VIRAVRHMINARIRKPVVAETVSIPAWMHRLVLEAPSVWPNNIAPFAAVPRGHREIHLPTATSHVSHNL